MKDHVHILLATYLGHTYIRGVFTTFNEAVKARKVMEEKKLNMEYSIGTYRVWEKLEHAQNEERL